VNEMLILRVEGATGQRPASEKLHGRPGNRLQFRRRLPKVTVTRAGVSLCQKGVTRWPLFLVNCLLAPKRAKTSRGRAASLSSRPLRSEVREASNAGSGGQKICVFPHVNGGAVGASLQSPSCSGSRPVSRRRD
jgi:hypothetical protein